MAEPWTESIVRDDCSFAILVAEFHYEGSEEYQGDLPEYSSKKWVIYRSQVGDKIQALADDVALWWRAYMGEDKMPPAVVVGGTEESHDIVVISADATIGSFAENFEAVKRQIEEMVAPYEGFAVTTGNIRDAKDIHAELAKMEKIIDEKRIAAKKKYMEPVDAFEKKANELKALITAKRKPIKDQLDAFERERVEERKKVIASLFRKIADEKLTKEQSAFFFDTCHGDQKVDSSWLNKGTTEKKIAEDIAKAIGKFLGDIAMIESLADGSELRDASYCSAYSKNMSFEDVMEAKRYLDRREEQMREAEAKKAVTPAPAPEPAPAKKEVKKEESEEITYCFTLSHTDPKAWLGLIQYIKDHGFTVISRERI